MLDILGLFGWGRDALEREFSIGGLSGVHSVKLQRGSNVMNKAGRIVLSGEYLGRKVKIFEAANEGHALFIESVLRHESLGGVFPRLLGRSGVFLVSDWVDGNTLKAQSKNRSIDDILKELAVIQAGIHSASIVALPLSQFDYWGDLILPRFKRAVDLLGEKDVIHRVLEDVSTGAVGGGLMHPDVTLSNVVISAEGKGKLIDNELLCVGGVPLLDVCNTARSLGDEWGQAYFDMYIQSSAPGFFLPPFGALNAAWVARSVGAAFVAGNIGQAKLNLHKYLSGGDLLPFSYSGI